MPKTHRGFVKVPKCDLVLVDPRIVRFDELVGIKLPPGSYAPAEAKREIACLPDFPRSFINRLDWLFKNPHSDLAVRLIFRILADIELAISLKLPCLIGNPSQHPALDCAEIRPD